MSEYISSITLTLKHFDHLWSIAYPTRSKEVYLEHRKTVEDGTWNNLGGLLEHAIHVRGNLVKHNTVGKDYTDGSDAKLASVRTCNKEKTYSAPITNIHQKKDLLRIVVYERKLDKFYYFLIPHNAYSHIPKTSNIEIPFNLDGTPKKENKCKINWWNYNKETFSEICVDSKDILKTWDKGNADNSEEIYYELTNFGGILLETIKAYPFNQNVHCGYTLVFNTLNIKPEDKTFLSLQRGYTFG